MTELIEFRKSSTQDEKCRKHGIERSLFCKGDGCQRNICPVCLMKDHSYHDVIAPENGFVYCSDICTVEMLNVMMADMAISARDGNQRPDVGVRSTEANPEEKLSPNNGEIVYNRKDEEEKGSKQIFSFTRMVQTKDSHHHCLITEYNHICFVSQIHFDNEFVVYGQRAGQWQLVRHKLDDGTALERVVLKSTPTCTHEVLFQGYPSIAMTYGNERRIIDLRELRNLSNILHSYSPSPFHPALCSSSAHSLISTTIDENGELDYSMECSMKSALQEVTCETMFRISQAFCYVESPVHAVITADTLGLHAIDVKSKQLLWTTDVSIVQSKTSKAVTSLTTNGRGILFAVDMANHCVQMFSAINGHYLGYLITEEEFGIGRPLYVNWCENTSTFILVHQKEEKKCINFFKM